MADAAKRIDPERCCSVCGGPITIKNVTGICTRNRACRSALQRKMTGGAQNGANNGDPSNSQWLLEPAYELCDEPSPVCDENGGYKVDENGNRIEIVDEVAIDIAVRGDRRVGLTETERREVIRRMIAGAWSPTEMAHHCGTIVPRIEGILNELGYEIVAWKDQGRNRNSNSRAKTLRRIKETV
jgi:hypothetical protein